MKLTIAFRDSDARTITYFLRRRYHSKANLENLAKLAIRTEVAKEAEIELKEAESKLCQI